MTDNKHKHGWSLNKIIHGSDVNSELLDKVFFYGDYLAHETASGEEDSGIRMVHKVDMELMKEEVEELYNLIATSSEMLAVLRDLSFIENELRFALCRSVGTKIGNSLSGRIHEVVAKAKEIFDSEGSE